MVPHIITSIINAENVTTLDISKCYIDGSFLSNQSSIEKKLWRFFNNNKFNGINFFNSSIKYIINNKTECVCTDCLKFLIQTQFQIQSSDNAVISLFDCF